MKEVGTVLFRLLNALTVSEIYVNKYRQKGTKVLCIAINAA